MSTPIKLAIIGAGSAQFSLGLVRDICLTPSLAGSLVSLMDIDQQRVDMVQSIATRYAAELGFDLRLEPTTVRETALRDADFVLNTASVAAHGGWSWGGIHNIRLMVDVARDMESLCPAAWLIQSGNPVFEGCTAMTRETSTRVIGLCHGHYGIFEVARVLGLDVDQLSWQAVGLNHVIYLTHFFYRGIDAYPLLDRWIEQEAETYWATHVPTYSDNQMSRAAIQQYQMVGYMPIGDTPRAGGWWYHTDLATKQRWYGHLGGFDSEIGWAQYVARLEESRAQMFAVAADPAARVTEVFPPRISREQIVPIIEALTLDQAGYYQVNIPNHGLISGLPDDLVVEVPAYVSRRGVQGLQVGRLPESVMAQVLLPRAAQAERTLSFARRPTKEGMLDLILHRHSAWTNHYEPPVASFEEAVAVRDQALRDDPMLAALIQPLCRETRVAGH